MGEKIKLRAGKKMVPAEMVEHDERIYLKFPFNRKLLDIVKSNFEKRKWDGDKKLWHFPVTPRNLFRLNHLMGKLGNEPYSRYDSYLDSSEAQIKKIIEVDTRGLFNHQKEMVAHGLMTKQFIWAAEMGTGKTLAAITLMEMSGVTDWFWIGPKAALRAVELEFKKWNSKIIPRFLTYEKLQRVLSEWEPGEPAPQGVIFDESSRIKTVTAKRTMASQHLADTIREEHDGYIGLLSGTPAPKAPLDWWSQCEVACPGFLAEGDIHMMKARVGRVETREGQYGNYPHLVTWYDDDKKCAICGLYKENAIHTKEFVLDGEEPSAEVYHYFVPTKNEVANLKKRLAGLVNVKFKKDCIDLPEKIYEEIVVEPDVDTVNAAKLILATSKRVVEAITKLRELSDGFQYIETPDGKLTCPECFGKKTVNFLEKDVECPRCAGSGEIDKMVRTAKQIPCPKDDVLIELLDLHEDIGRLNVYAGFTGSIDRIVDLCHKQGWSTIRVDGRGWDGERPDGTKIDGNLLEVYTTPSEDDEKIVFIGQPGAAGMGLTLTISPTTFFWSNDFNAENRIQAEDRGHRIGMDKERGGRIVDVFHLDTDRVIFNNLKAKRDLQKLTMEGLKKEIEDAGPRTES